MIESILFMDIKTTKYYNRDLVPSIDWIAFDTTNPILRQGCTEIYDINHESDQDLLNIQKMVSYIEHSFEGDAEQYGIKPGIAITANQIGWAKAVVYIHFMDEFNVEQQLLIANPRIVKESDNFAYIRYGEGCLSVQDDVEGLVIRKEWVDLEGYDLLNRKPIKLRAKNYFGMCVQHELDHVHGKLYYDRINKKQPLAAKSEWKVIG